MKSAGEKIYNFLKKKDRPVSLEEICRRKELSGLSRREIARTLQVMSRLNMVFRCLKDGKPYYSVDSDDGEGGNGVRELIFRIQSIGDETDTPESPDGNG